MTPTEATSTATASPARADRISALYRAEILADEKAHDRIRWMCAQCEGERVLDVGCSLGTASILLAREGFTVTVLDARPETIASARQEIAQELPVVRERVQLIEGDLAGLPEQPGYDTILLGEVLGHQVRPERLLRAAKARLNPGGILVCATPFGLHPHPDHKISLFPRNLAGYAATAGLAIRSMIADGQGISCVLVHASEDVPRQVVDLASLTERAALESQARLFTRINEQDDQLRSKASALETAQARLAEIGREHETLRVATRDQAAELAALRARGQELDARHAKELADADAALRDEKAVRRNIELQRATALEELASAQAKLAAVTREGEALRHTARDQAVELAKQRTRGDKLNEAVFKHKAQHAKELAEAATVLQSEQAARQKAERQRVATLRELTTAREALANTEARVEQMTAAAGEAQRAAAALEARTKVNTRRARIKMEGRIRDLTLAHTYESTTLKERNDRLMARLRATQASFAATKATTSYRLGRLLVRGFKSPKAFVALPLDLARLGHDVLRRRRLRALLGAQDDPGAPDAPTTASKISPQPVGAPATKAKPAARAEPPAGRATPSRGTAKATEVPVALEPEALEIELLSGGVPAVRSHLIAHGSGVAASARALAALALGRLVAKSAGAETDFALADLALEFDRSEPVLRGYFWAAQRSLRMEAAYAAYRELETFYARHPEPRFEALRDKLQRSPTVQLQAFELVVDSPIEPIEPLANRICYVLHNSLPYSSGGYATRAQGVSGGLKEAGYDVVVVTRPGFPIDTKPELRGTSVPAEDQIDGDRYVRILEPERTPGMPVLPYMKAAAEAVERQLRVLRPAVVIAASNYRTALPALIAARRMGVPFVYEVRGFWEVTRISREPEYQDTPAYAAQCLLEAKVAQLADHVFTLTGPMADELIKRGVPAGKIGLLPNSCDPQRFLPRARDEALAAQLAIPMGTPVIGYVGTFVDYEGLQDLALACAMLKQRGLVFRLLLVGNENASGTNTGPITAEILRIADEQGMRDWLIMPGRVPHEMVEAYYSLIDVAAFPRKPWPVCEMVSPMKPLEALAMEKAVLVSSVRALTEMIADEHTGLVFAKGDTTSMADALARLIADPALRARLGRNGRSWVCAERTWTQVGRKLDSHLRELLARGTPAKAEASTSDHHDGSAAAPPARQLEQVLPSVPTSSKLPGWWKKIDRDFRERCSFVDVSTWKAAADVSALRGRYVERFGADAVARRMPSANWSRADICARIVPASRTLLDVGSGLGEFVNLAASRGRHGRVTSFDRKDWDLWMDDTGAIERIHGDLFNLDKAHERDVVTCFEVIEHVPTDKVETAVRRLRSVAREHLLVSVPFLEPLPLYKGHLTRFDHVLLERLFPDARFTVFGKGDDTEIRAWILCAMDINVKERADEHGSVGAVEN